jgi:hypothetical protein
MFLATSIRASFRAALAYSGSTPDLDPKNTQIRFNQ